MRHSRNHSSRLGLRPALLGLALASLAVGPLGAQAASSDPWSGTWLGTLSVGAVSLRLVFNITMKDGSYTATMDSPDQGAKGVPVSGVTAAAGTITLEVKVAAGVYAGALSPDGLSIDGTWKQGAAAFPVLLQKQAGAFALERPQEPKPPFPYTSTDVTFTDVKAGVTLAGTLTVPQGKGQFPAVVLVTGSGPQNRDEALMGHRPFAVIADFLSRNGIAVLRYDDRGVGASKGSFATATTLDLADDAEAAFTYLASRPEVDAKRVGIAGHSEGGEIAPIVAARNPSVAFIILLAGPGLRGDALLLAQAEALARASGADDATIAWSHTLNVQLYGIAAGPGDAASVLDAATKAYAAGIDAAPGLTEQQKADAKKGASQAVASLASPWFRTFLALDPAAYLAKVRVPVLAMNGTKDLQVPADPDLAAISAALKAGGNSRVTLLKLDGLNHLFQHADTGLPAEYGQITETFAPEALAAMREFVVAGAR
jgi:uncharacterized protein